MRVSKLIYPRPVCLIVTVNRDGRPNVATFSFVTPVSFDPKLIAFFVSPKRYTFHNLRECGGFSVNLLSHDQKDLAEKCGSVSGRDVDKFKEFNIKAVKSRFIKAPLVDGCPVQLECRVIDFNMYGDHFLVVGKVLAEHVNLDVGTFKPLLHISSDIYAVGVILK